MKKVLSALLVAAATTCANAQYFQQLYGTTDAGEVLTSGHNAYQGGANGHFLTGPTGFSGTSDLLVQRADMNGTTTSGPPYFNNIYQLSDPLTSNQLNVLNSKSFELANGNGFAIAGSYIVPGSGTFGIYYLRLTPNGTVGAVAGYYPNATFPVNTIIVTSVTPSLINNNELYICGFVRESSAAYYGYERVFVIKIDMAGTMLWSNIYDLNVNTTINHEIPYGIVESATANAVSRTTEVMVVGAYMETTTAASTQDGFLFRIDYANGLPVGNVQLYGGSATNMNDVFTSIDNAANTVIDPNGAGYIISGYSDAQGTYDFWFTAVDQAGNLSWSNLFDYSPSPNTNKDFAYDVIERLNSGNQYEYYIGGSTDNGPFGNADAMVIKTDASGNGVGQFCYGDINQDNAIQLDQLNGFGANSDGLCVYGSSNNGSGYSIGGTDHYLVKSYFSGETACNYQLNNPLQYTGGLYLMSVTPGLLDQLYQFSLNANQPLTASENNICFVNAIGAPASNFKEHRVAGKTPGAQNSAGIFPNPVQAGNAEVDVKMNFGSATQAEMKVVDMLGRVYYSSTVRTLAGENHVKLQLPALKAGTYLVTVTSATDQYKTILMVK